MKNSTFFLTRPVISFFSVLILLGVSSCSPEPQRLLFSNHPTEFKRIEKVAPTPTPPESAPLMASNNAEPTVVLTPEAYKREKAAAEIIRNQAVREALARAPKITPDNSSREKVTTLKEVKKEIKAARKEIKNLKDTKKVAAGPVSNDVAIKIIIVGLIVALLGLIVGPLGGIGGLIVLVGLVLLLLNYL